MTTRGITLGGAGATQFASGGEHVQYQRDRNRNLTNGHGDAALPGRIPYIFTIKIAPAIAIASSIRAAGKSFPIARASRARNS